MWQPLCWLLGHRWEEKHRDWCKAICFRCEAIKWT